LPIKDHHSEGTKGVLLEILYKTLLTYAS